MNETLKTLINTSPSFTDEERGYWFHTIPHMTQMQEDRLFEMLSNERRKLDDLYS